MSASDRVLTPQQQLFVFAILQGKTQLDAYKAAGYRGGKNAERTDSTLRKDASRTARLPQVQGALARARAELAASTGITVDTLVQRLERAYEVALAIDPPQINGAVAATMGIGKLLGLVIDRAQVDVALHKPAFSSKALELSEDEWKRQFDTKLVK